MKNIVGAEVDDEQLQYQRRATHDRYVNSRNVLDQLVFGHAAERDGEPERQRADERECEYRYRGEHAVGELGEHKL